MEKQKLELPQKLTILEINDAKIIALVKLYVLFKERYALNITYRQHKV